MAQAMGLGKIGSAAAVFKRKFRWTMSISYCTASPKIVPPELVKIGARPSIDVEETQIDYLHGRFWIPGKATWNEMTVTYYDVAGTLGLSGGGSILNLFGWIASVYDITDPVNLNMGSTLSSYEGTGTLLLYDGCGNTLESWVLNHMWPKSVNFGELDMESSDVCTVELTVRYSEVTYTSLCPSGTVSKCACVACS